MGAKKYNKEYQIFFCVLGIPKYWYQIDSHNRAYPPSISHMYKIRIYYPYPLSINIHPLSVSNIHKIYIQYPYKLSTDYVSTICIHYPPVTYPLSVPTIHKLHIHYLYPLSTNYVSTIRIHVDHHRRRRKIMTLMAARGHVTPDYPVAR